MSLGDIYTLLGIITIVVTGIVALARHFAKDNEREARITRIEKHLNLNGKPSE